MLAYSEKTTQELIDLLITEEDRVTLEHIQELARREDAIEPLRTWLLDRNRWTKAEHGEWWALYHAFTILCLTRRPELLDDLLQAYLFADEENFDWLTEVAPSAFAQFGEAAVEPLIQFIMQERSKTNWSAGFRRAKLVAALTRIVLEHPSTRPRIAEFICGRFSDPEETDQAFLGLITGNAWVVDKERALEPMRLAFERDAMDESISGNYQETVEWYDKHDPGEDSELTHEFLEFYQPEEIANRQVRWKQEKEEEARRAKQKEADEIAQRIGFQSAEEPEIPSGYFQAAEGNLIREEKIGRNDPCPCGSGKKYKKCHGK